MRLYRVMFDGSQLPRNANTAETARIVEMAHTAGASCGDEIGVVGYADGAAGAGADPGEAARRVLQSAR